MRRQFIIISDGHLFYYSRGISFVDAAHLPLVFAPESGNMLGGTVVNITGPCFNENERVSCRFDTEEVIGHFVDRNRVICVQPFLMAQGYIRFEISVGTEKYKWRGRYFVGKSFFNISLILLQLTGIMNGILSD